MLEKRQAELKEDEVHPRLVDKLNLELWKAYRYAACMWNHYRLRI